MKKLIFSSFLGTAILAGLSVVPAHAKNHGGHGMHMTKAAKHKHMKKMHHANPMPNLMRVIMMQGDKLDLSPEQEIALAKWRKQHKPVSKKLVADIIAGEKTLMLSSLAGVPKADLMRAFDHIATLRRQMAEMKSNCRDNMRKVLSKEQFSKVTALYKEMAAKHHKKMKKATDAGNTAKLSVSGVWARKSLISGGNSAAFMSIRNNGADNILVEARSDIAQIIELHNHTMVDGIMRMREVKGGIPLQAGATTELKPGGLHVMLIKLTRDLKEGDSFPLELVFKDGASQKINVSVKGMKGGMHKGYNARGSHH